MTMNIIRNYRFEQKRRKKVSITPTIQGVGIDIEEVARFRACDPMIQKSFYRGIFTDKEMKYCMSKKDPYPYFTVRFCAKEAVVKALDRTRFGLKNIEITNDSNGRPRVRMKEKKVDYTIAISLSHTKEYATAIALWLP